ncbi:MAG TPA: hypothetical protein VN947_25725 [Polyangia bacterium]|nr:hypothetical protein [Polyangia bacterium]
MKKLEVVRKITRRTPGRASWDRVGRWDGRAARENPEFARAETGWDGIGAVESNRRAERVERE